MDKTLPRNYPSQALSPKIRIKNYELFLHCRTGELYLGTGTFREQLYLSLYWDKNVFSDDVVQEWVGETRQAMYFYLGDTQARGSKL